MRRLATIRIARGLLVSLAAAFTLGLRCDPKSEFFFELIDESLIPGQGDIFGEVIVDGLPRQGVTVTLRNSSGQVIATDVTDQFGEYGFINVDPGSYTVSIDPPSGTTCTPSQKPATVIADDETFVDFSCATPQPTTGTLTVTVTVGGTPQSGATVVISHTGGTQQGTTNASGVVTFTNLTPGAYSVTTTLTNHTCGAGSGTVVAGDTVNVPVSCTLQMSTVPTTAQIQGGWNVMRTRTSTTGSCPAPLAGSGSATMTALSMTSLGANGVDTDVNLSGNYNLSTGAFSGSGSTMFQNGVTVNTTFNATFSFDGSQNPQYVDVMVRMHVFGGNTVCTENYMTTGSRAVASGARFKSGIVSLLPDGVTLLGLRPVSFRYRAPYGNPRAAQVGLIAEEVARVFPGAVAMDEHGRPAGIWYDRLTGLVGKELGARVERKVDAAIVRLAKKL